MSAYFWTGTETCPTEELMTLHFQLLIMNRKHIAKFRITERRNDNFVPGAPEERIAMVWELTREACLLSKHLDAERRLQRHITRLIRRKG